MPTKVSQEQIYYFLCQEFPEKFLRLQSLPKEIAHPGNQPKEPRSHFTASFSVSRKDSIESLFENLEQIAKESNNQSGLRIEISSGFFSIGREVVEVERKLEYDWHHNGQPDDDSHEVATYYDVPSKYGQVDSFHLNVTFENPNRYDLRSEYEIQLNHWKDRILQCKRRKELRKEIEKDNDKLIKTCRDSNLELWKQAGKHLSCGDNQDWLRTRAQYFRDKLAEIENKLCPVVNVNEATG